jgi:hypothetical protein
MALVTFTAGDCNLAEVATLGLEIVFTLDEFTNSDTGFRITKDVRVPVPSDSAVVSADLADTATMYGLRHYKMRAEWPDPNFFGAPGEQRGMMRVDFPEVELRVPIGGGNLKDLLPSFPWNPFMWITSPTQPDFWPLGAYWLDSSVDTPTSGDYRERIS